MRLNLLRTALETLKTYCYYCLHTISVGLGPSHYFKDADGQTLGISSVKCNGRNDLLFPPALVSGWVSKKMGEGGGELSYNAMGGQIGKKFLEGSVTLLLTI